MSPTVKLKTLGAFLCALVLGGCFGSGPDIDVIVRYGERGASEIVQGIPHIIVRSREEGPILVKSILINNSRDCQSLMGLPMPSPFPATLRTGQAVSLMSACEPVKIVVSTDRGEATFTFH